MGDEEAFTREGDMCYLITTVKHEHLVQLLATYVHKGKYHLLFPFTEANLRIFWEAVPTPNWNRATYLWVLGQITGLASALMAIHLYKSNPAYKTDLGKPGPVFSRFMTAGRKNVEIATGEEKFGRHGDMKPDTILWRGNEKDLNSHGTLIITDLGLCDIYRANSVSKVSPNDLRGSQTYMAPELVLMMPVSRAYDIWGLGCIYLEFITWLLTGVVGLEKFHDSRCNPTLDSEVEDDAYFTLHQSANGKYTTTRPAVVECIKSLRQNHKCSAMIREVLDLVEKFMLLVDPQARINAVNLHSRLWDIHQRSKKEAEYLAGTRPHDEGKGFIAPERSPL